MPSDRPLQRRQVLRLATLATGASLFPSACRAINSTVADNKVTAQSASSSPLNPPQISKVVLVYNEDRSAGTRQALDLLQPTGLKGKTVFLKPNYNTGDPAPAATDSQLLETLIQEFQGAEVGEMTIGDRSGMADTRQAMEQKGVFQLGEKYGVKTLVFDEMEAEKWQYISAEGTHWQKGFAFARPILDSEAIVNTCCLKTHQYGGHFTLSLKNSVGMVAKYVPGDSFNYMGDLHSSAHQRLMIAEINQAYKPSLVLLDGVEAFVNGGPASGKKIRSNVILAGVDRVAIDVVAIALLRLLGTTNQVSNGSIWELEQIQRAVELGLGIGQSEQIEFITPDAKSREIVDQIRPLIT
ncbi:DUF362 domain-containing protein [Cyanobacterium aponinum AL20118]|uniref:DUF362 domain-containing protein n=1 Tax=Cyanobacterium aponinum AL20115 TaxID=3090662 RepID=A0AAF0ZJC3_9CHRO|nr:DUF362 domain-containing protein [Cyanobacterium aponinum]WPF89297.1 DUF362 domain-containing protein [Cyanobacterium aponinum AL20115]